MFRIIQKAGLCSDEFLHLSYAAEERESRKKAMLDLTLHVINERIVIKHVKGHEQTSLLNCIRLFKRATNSWRHRTMGH